jgi:hypothetical protein
MESFFNIPHRTQKDFIDRELSDFESDNSLHDIFQDSIDAIQNKIVDSEEYSDATELAYQQLREIRKLNTLFNDSYLATSFTQT